MQHWWAQASPLLIHKRPRRQRTLHSKGAGMPSTALCELLTSRGERRRRPRRLPAS